MRSRTAWILLLLALLFLAWAFWPEGRIEHAPGVVAPDTPVQFAVSDDPWAYEGYTIKPRAGIAIEAMVLSKEGYGWDREAQLAPYDLALGWGPMSDSSVLSHLEISQSGRWYHYRWQGPLPIGEREIARHSGNMHMIPATRDIERRLADAVPGHIVRIRGQLVDITATDGWRWTTSTSRLDTGGGSCEVVWVEAIELLETLE